MPAIPRQVEQYRRALATLTGLAAKDLDAMWASFTSADAARDGLKAVLPRLVATYGSAAGTLAADWYDDHRAEVGAAGRFRAVVAELPADLGTDELAGWAVSPLYKPEPDWSAAKSLVEGGVKRRIQNVSRATITESSIADPAAKGWQRAGSGECPFCAMLIGRGSVYSEAGADFASHDHCNCTAVPAFEGQARPVKPYTPSKRVATDTDRARVRAYLRDNP